MSSIENEIMPELNALINGENITLNEPKQKMISLWVLKTVLMRGLLDEGGDPAIMEHYSILKSLTIPANTHMWLVNVDKKVDTYSTRHMRLSDRSKIDTANGFHKCIAYASSINISRISFQLFSFVDKVDERDYDLSYFLNNLNAHHRKIWPKEENVITWPPAKSISFDPWNITPKILNTPLLK